MARFCGKAWQESADKRTERTLVSSASCWARLRPRSTHLRWVTTATASAPGLPALLYHRRRRASTK